MGAAVGGQRLRGDALGPAYALEVSQDMAVDRREAKLEFKPPVDGIERTLRMLSNSSTTLFRGDKSLTFSEKMDGYVLEHLFPDSRGLGPASG